MKELIRRGALFVKNNQTIISSLLLIFIVIGALFLNSYVAINRFQGNIDKTLRSKAMLVENVIGIAADNYFMNLPEAQEELQNKLAAIKDKDDQIAAINLFVFDSQKQEYFPSIQIFSEGNIDIENKDPYKELIAKNARKFALSVPDAFAYLSNEKGVRYWNVVKSVSGKNDNVLGILEMKLSLSENDALVEKTISQVYLFSIAAVILVLLLVFNHLRLFSYEVKAKKLEEIDKMKDDFISMASHELKTPLTAISGYSELLRDTLVDSSKSELISQKKYLNNIDLSVARLKTLVEDVLNVSRIEQNRLPFDLKSTDTNAIIESVYEEMKVVADEKKLELINSAGNLPLVMADTERIKQILVNLISNAIKYSPKGKIDIQGSEDDKWVYITVADNGIGIANEDLKELFSKFYRIHNKDTQHISGSGLGLWIAREIAQKMGGSLTVESIKGVGSHFTLKLKKA